MRSSAEVPVGQASAKAMATRIPLGLGHDDRIVLVVAGCDHDEVPAGMVEVALQMMVAIPVHLTRTITAEDRSEVSLRSLVGLIVVESLVCHGSPPPV